MKTRGLSGILAAALMLPALPVFAEGVPTRVMVRVISRDAKIIGDLVGGAEVTIRDAASNAVLAKGVQTGGSGDTQLIMDKPRERSARAFDTPGAAGFLAEIELEKPTVVEVTAVAPLGAPEAIQRASKTLLLVPGEHVLGDGVLLEIHGFIVKLLAPEPGTNPKAGELDLRASVTMTCGCPTEPGGLWDASKLRVVAQLHRGGKVVQEVPLAYAGQTSTFAGRLSLAEPGPAEIVVLAMDPEDANFGMVRRGITVAPQGSKEKSIKLF